MPHIGLYVIGHRVSGKKRGGIPYFSTRVVNTVPATGVLKTKNRLENVDGDFDA